jgi:hypothetical protein
LSNCCIPWILVAVKFVTITKKKPNIVVEWLTLLLHIQEVPGSYLGPGD